MPVLPTGRAVVTVDTTTKVIAPDAKVPAAQVTGATGSVSVSGSTLTFTSADGKTTSTATLPAGGGSLTATESTTVPGAYSLSDGSGTTATESSSIPGAYAI